ncbi:hypothetical protein ACIRG4_34570 [Streptomyces sp. NPDC102395]|uniref:hypothetical protein n=1 Tax=Streptomyces sp. NPDC102395 TaxID=3366168 RepID=UPI00380A45DB
MAVRPWLDVRRPWRSGHAPALIVIPLGLIVTVCVVDVLAPPHIHLGPLLVAAPAITVAFAGARVTALMGALAVAAQVLIGVLRGVLPTANIQAQIIALVIVSTACVAVCVVRDRREQQLHQVRSVAVAAQSVLLQPLPARAGRVPGSAANARRDSSRIAAVCRSTASVMAGSTRDGRAASWCAASARR